MTTIRSGTVLIIVAGICGLLASITISFIAKIQDEVQSNVGLTRMVQARIMLTAACNYIQEASRLGWESPSYHGRYHLESYGWVDVRDGELGPKTSSDRQPRRSIRTAIPFAPEADHTGTTIGSFPVGEPRRFPMHVKNRPPFAIHRAIGNNPICQNPNQDDYLKILLRYPDPLPAIDNGWRRDASNPAGKVTDARFADWCRGDPIPRPETFGLSWFRIMREPGGSVFLVTCGSGGTMGYRNWEEVSKEPDSLDLFQSRDQFEGIQHDEMRIWYRLEWSPLIQAADANVLHHDWAALDHYLLSPYNGSVERPVQTYQNFGGTITWVQRLPTEPANW